MWLDVFYENAGCKCLFFFFSFLLPLLLYILDFRVLSIYQFFFFFFLPSAIVL